MTDVLRNPGPGRGIIAACRRIAASAGFQHGILAVIVGNAILIGIETDAALAARHAALFNGLNAAIQAVFVLEIAIRVLACAPRPWRFFRDGWNVFDFAIVGLSLLPAAGSLATIGRLARLLRALRVVSALPELRLIVSTMLRSLPSLGNVIVLLGLILYVYAVLGVHLFGEADPVHWASLPRAALTLFEILTLEGWVDLMDASTAATPWAWVYYVSFVVLAVFVVVNLFIAIVINNLEAAKHAESAASRDVPVPGSDPARALREIRMHLAEIEAAIGTEDPRPEGLGLQMEGRASGKR